ncbi:DUF1614 domain-containing protein [Halanaerobaculum tunisiense]
MPIGVVILVGLELLIYFGVAEEMLKHLGIDRQTILLFLAAMIIGSFIDLPLSDAPRVEINVGGAIIPLILAGYLLTRVDNSSQLIRALFAVLATGGAIFALTKLYQFEEGHTLLDTNFLFPIVAGVVAYLVGRSRRVAFIAGTLGFVVYDLFHLLQVTMAGIPADIRIGGAGIFDSIVISGLLAVLLAELVGESRERLTEEENLFDTELVEDMEFGKLENGAEGREEDEQED